MNYEQCIYYIYILIFVNKNTVVHVSSQCIYQYKKTQLVIFINALVNAEININ